MMYIKPVINCLVWILNWIRCQIFENSYRQMHMPVIGHLDRSGFFPSKKSSAGHFLDFHESLDSLFWKTKVVVGWGTFCIILVSKVSCLVNGELSAKRIKSYSGRRWNKAGNYFSYFLSQYHRDFSLLLICCKWHLHFPAVEVAVAKCMWHVAVVINFLLKCALAEQTCCDGKQWLVCTGIQEMGYK